MALMSIEGLLCGSCSMVNRINALKKNMGKTEDRLTTGKNLLTDNPAIIFDIEHSKGVINGDAAAQENIQDGVSLLQTAENSISSSETIAGKLQTLSAEYNNGTATDEKKAEIREQAKALTTEMGYILNHTDYNGENIFDKTSIGIQAGCNAGDKISIDIPNSLNQKAEKTASQTTSAPAAAAGTVVTAHNGSTGETVPQYTDGMSAVNIPDQTGFTGYTKVYENDHKTLIYEGNLTNGKPYGYGTYYINGKAAYEGNWNNGTANDWGRVYNSDGSIRFEGNTANGIPDGYAKIFDNSGRIQYEGSLQDGYRQGWGMTYYTNGATNAMIYNDYTRIQQGGGKPSPGGQQTASGNGDGSQDGGNTQGGGQSQGFSLRNIAQTDVETILQSGFIEKNVQKPLADAESHFASDENVLDIRAGFLNKQQETENQHLSNLQDTDYANQIVSYVKQQMLLNANTAVLSQSLQLSQSLSKSLLENL